MSDGTIALMLEKLREACIAFAVLRMGSQFMSMTVLCPGSGKGMRCT